jgi:cell division protein ZapA
MIIVGATFRLRWITQAEACGYQLTHVNFAIYNDTSTMGGMNRMGKERLVEIKVFGQVYTVKTDAQEGHIQKVAQYVNEKMDEVTKNTKSVSSLNVAILTALNIADDLIIEKARRLALLEEVERKSKDLVEKINMNINGKEAEEALIAE